jgi:hypothetical protein
MYSGSLVLILTFTSSLLHSQKTPIEDHLLCFSRVSLTFSLFFFFFRVPSVKAILSKLPQPSPTLVVAAIVLAGGEGSRYNKGPNPQRRR